MHYLWSRGYDVYGIDAVEENIQVARELHPEIAERVNIADLRRPLEFQDDSLDFVICNGVIQHIEPDCLVDVTLPEFARVLRPGGVLQLMFKNGRGVITVYDRDYKVERSFQLYDEHEVLNHLGASNLRLLEAEEPNSLGGVMYFTDPKPVDHCVFFVQKYV